MICLKDINRYDIINETFCLQGIYRFNDVTNINIILWFLFCQVVNKNKIKVYIIIIIFSTTIIINHIITDKLCEICINDMMQVTSSTWL